MLYTRTIKDHRSLFNRNMNLNHTMFNKNRHLEFGFETMPTWQAHQHLGYATPDTDILELDDQYVLELALPGVVLDDVEIKVEENVLTVVAKRTPAMFEEKASIIRKELPTGFLVREFYFETEILHDQIEARMDRGILFIAIPKMEAALRIPVSAGSIEGHLPTLKTRVQKSEMTNRKEVVIK
ncbi:MAG TPA: Hsp20/alpha crystallin family protein [Oculatellaceae cyanobacterium]